MSGTKLCVLGLAVFALALCAAGAPVCSDVCIKASAENSYVVRTGSKQTSRSLPGQGGCHSQEDMRDAGEHCCKPAFPRHNHTAAEVRTVATASNQCC